MYSISFYLYSMYIAFFFTILLLDFFSHPLETMDSFFVNIFLLNVLFFTCSKHLFLNAFF